jgi:hypothetical protein
MFSEPNNPRAMTAYRFAIYGLIPVAGLLLGPMALALGLAGWRHARQNPDRQGVGHAVTAVILGALEVLTNAVGLALIWIGIESLGA